MKLLVKITTALVAAGLLLSLVAAGYVYFVLVPQLPAVDRLEDTEYQVPLRVYDREGLLLAEYGEHRRIPVKYEAIPKKIEQAFLAAEDDQFWTHYGVDPLALMAAVYELVTTGTKTRGGSTITMQVARNFFLSSEKTYSRKLNEILLALKIEKELDKKTILELYLNKIYLGNRAYGVVAAAQVYYGKTLDELSIAQAAMIAGLPKAPSRYNPIINPERALIRRDHILRRMRQLGYIDEEQYQQAKAEPVSAELHGSKVSADARYVTEMVRKKLYEQYGDEIYSSGMKVYTTIDKGLQVAANQALRKALLDYDRRHGYRGHIGRIDWEQVDVDPFEDGLVEAERVGNLVKGVVKSVEQDKAVVVLPDFRSVEVPFEKGIDWARDYISENRLGPELKSAAERLQPGDVIWVEQRDDLWLLAQVPDVEGAIVSLDPENGAIRALVGGFDYFRNKFNRATQAKRQPGSNFKPFIYSAALEKGFTAATLINDAPVVFDDDSLEATWRPENYSGRVYGPTRLREALVKSRNLVSIRILQSIGLRYAVNYVQRFGFRRDEMPYDLSLALGSGAFAPLEIVRGYSVFASGGYRTDPYFIERIESNDGELLYRADPLVVCRKDCQAGESPVSDQEQPSEEKGEPAVKSEVAEADGSKSAGEEGEKPAVVAEAGPPRPAPRVISEENAYIMRSMLREVVRRGTAVRAKVLGRPDLAGKTGTTNDQKDAWFSGFADGVVTTAWVGFDDQKPLGSRETGGRAALPMWIDFMRVALKDAPVTTDQQPDGVVSVRIDADTGERATARTVNSRFELFVQGTEPQLPDEMVTNSEGGEPGFAETRGGEPTVSEEEAVEELF